MQMSGQLRACPAMQDLQSRVWGVGFGSRNLFGFGYRSWALHQSYCRHHIAETMGRVDLPS